MIGISSPLVPPCTGRQSSNVAAPNRAQRARAGRPAFEAAEPAQGSRMRIGFCGTGSMAVNLDPLGWGVTPEALRPDFVGSVRLLTVVFELADEAASADPQEHDGRLA